MTARINPLIDLAAELCAEVDKLQFDAPVSYIYNPLSYAWQTHTDYLNRYGQGPKEVILVGMNPGPFGMAQTGVPFGDIKMVREWLGIEGEVDKPPKEHAKRPVEGFNCPRSEVSGTRVWTWAKERFAAPQKFFERFFVVNYCPLVFMEESGKNRTPDKLPALEQQALFDICNRTLEKTVKALEAKYVIGIGAFAEKRIEATISGNSIKTGRILHPSPASPKANRGWASQAEKELEEIGINLP